MELQYIGNLSQITQNLIATAVLLGLAFIGKSFGAKIIATVVSKVDGKDDSKDSVMEKRAKTLGSLTNNALGVTLWGIAMVTVLSKWGIDIAPLLLGAGVVGLAIGFGTQSVVRDLVTGFLILFENQYNVGDKVKVAGLEGEVLQISLRTTVIRENESRNVHVIPNSQISTITKLAV